jgi:hypothetical protein
MKCRLVYASDFICRNKVKVAKFEDKERQLTVFFCLYSDKVVCDTIPNKYSKQYEKFLKTCNAKHIQKIMFELDRVSNSQRFPVKMWEDVIIQAIKDKYLETYLINK